MAPRADPVAVRRALDEATRESRSRWLAGLVRRTNGDFERAEDALGDACAEALTQWCERGIPDDPAAWIATVAGRRLVDAARSSRARRDREEDEARREERGDDVVVRDARIDFGSDDDTLRLVFTCCHPALATESRVALTLNAISGLDSAAISRAFLVDEGAMTRRITRAKQKIRDAGIPFGVLAATDVPERLPFVLKTIELIFNEGYAQARGDSLDAPSLAEEAVRLARELFAMMPHETEVAGLLALVLFTHARRDARIDGAGNLVRLPEQDRARWDARIIDEAADVLRGAVRSGGEGPFVLRAALSGEHSMAPTAAATRWERIVGLYDALLELEDSPVVALNRAIAVGELEGPAGMLDALDAIGARLDGYHYLHAARGDALEKLGRAEEARASFERALVLARNEAERRHVAERLRACGRRDAGD